MFDKRKDNVTTSPGSGYTSPAASSAAVSASMGKAALIGEGIHINGDISGTENLIVEGSVEGKIELVSHQLSVGKAGRVAANVVAKTVRVDGELNGDVDGKEKVIISNTGNVRGNIKAPRVILEDGAVFKGSIDITPVESAVAELPLPASKQTASGEAVGKDSGVSAKNR